MLITFCKESNNYNKNDQENKLFTLYVLLMKITILSTIITSRNVFGNQDITDLVKQSKRAFTNIKLLLLKDIRHQICLLSVTLEILSAYSIYYTAPYEMNGMFHKKTLSLISILIAIDTQ
ncbi:hypothetical protein DKP78_12310 [Enterococcus faecium]|nr:hypothetical protein DKP78_12310 [Enterococcus faecium]